MHRTDKAIRRGDQKRKLMQAVEGGSYRTPDGEIVTHPRIVWGERKAAKAIATRLRGGDRRAANMQLRAAMTDPEVDVIGSGKLLSVSMVGTLRLRTS